MPSSDERRSLEQSDWLQSTSADFRSELLAGAHLSRAPPGTVVSVGGDEQGELIGLIDGIVGVSIAHDVFDSPVMHYLRPVSWFGFGPILAPDPRRFHIIAQTEVRIATVTTSRVRSILSREPSYYRFFIPLLLQAIDHLTRISSDLLVRGSQTRCVAVLLRLAGNSVDVPLTQDDLAVAANLSRNTVGVIIRALTRAGLVRPAYRRLSILRRDELVRLLRTDS